MHLRLDDLRKQARMLQMYEWERSRKRSFDENGPIRASGPGAVSADQGLGAEREPLASLKEPVQPID